MSFFKDFGNAIISGGAGLISGITSSIFGKKSNDSANETNMKIAQMNNEWSEKMMEKQNQMNIAQWQRESAFAKQQADAANAFTEYMQDKANEYNSASAQAQRLRQAGLNPALVMNGGNAGTAQGASGAQASTPSGNSIGLPSPSSAQVRPYDYSGIGNSITNAVTLALQVQKQQAEVTNMQLQNQYLRESMNNRLKEQYENMRSKKYDTDLRELRENNILHMDNEQYLSAVTSRLMANEQINLAKQAYLMNQIVHTNLSENIKADISLKLAQAESLTMPEFAKMLKFFESRFGEKISKDDLRTIYNAWKGMQTDQRWQNWISSIGGGISDIVGAWSGLKRPGTQIYSPHNHYTSIYGR